MSDLVFEILNVAIKLLVVLFVAYILPVSKNLIEKILSNAWAKDAVNTAQQIMVKQTGAERKEFAVKKLQETLDKANIVMTEEQINLLIESAVKQLRIEEAKAETNITVTTEPAKEE